MKTYTKILVVMGLFILTFASAGFGWIRHDIDADCDYAIDSHAVDLDRDGDLDVVAAGKIADTITWYENWDNHGVVNFIEHTINPAVDGVEGVFAIDVDGDEDVDVLSASEYENQISWWENDGGEHFTEHVIDGDFSGARDVHAADIESDGDVDVVGVSYNNNEVALWINDGTESFTKEYSSDTFYGACRVFAVDLNLDGEEVDFIASAHTGDQIAWWRNDYGNFYKEEVDYSFNGAKGVYARDVDCDHDIDILGAAYDADEIAWYKNNGNQVNQKETIDNNVSGAWGVFSEDMVDGDGIEEVLGTAWKSGDLYMWTQDGEGNWEREVITDDFGGASSVSASDIDDDGDMDILATACGDDMVTWWENETDPEATTSCSCPDPFVRRGDQLLVYLTLANRTDTVVTFDCWVIATLPNYLEYELGSKRGITLPPNRSITYPLRLAVPPVAPLGNYGFRAYIGTYPIQPDWVDYFIFTVIP